MQGDVQPPSVVIFCTGEFCRRLDAEDLSDTWTTRGWAVETRHRRRRSFQAQVFLDQGISHSGAGEPDPYDGRSAQLRQALDAVAAMIAQDCWNP